MVMFFRFCHTLNIGVSNRVLHVFVPNTFLNERVLGVFLNHTLISGYSIFGKTIRVSLRYTNGNLPFESIRPLLASRKAVFVKKNISTFLGVSSSTNGFSLVPVSAFCGVGVPFFIVTRV